MNTSVALPLSGGHLPETARLTIERGLLTDHAIRVQLSKIFESKGFVRAERMRRFLEFVVEETLVGRANQLCEYTIGTAVFERDESFEPGLDPIVRNDARRLRQKLLEYYHRSPREQDDDQIVIDIPKGGYVPLFRAASNAEALSGCGKFRLIARLICVEDGAEVWNTERDFQINEQSDEPCFALQFQVRRHYTNLRRLRT
jgi:hypothetical protein